MMKSGDITDIAGIKVGHADNRSAGTGCTIFVFQEAATAAVDVRGSASGSRSLDSLKPGHVVTGIHGLMFCGGSAFGLAAVSGAVKALEERNIGHKINSVCIPIIPAAVIFDLNVGDPRIRPDENMGKEACEDAWSSETKWGCVGVGTGAAAGKLKGIKRAVKTGIGSALIEKQNGLKIGAAAAVNSFGSVIDPADGKVIAGVRAEEPGKYVDPFDWFANYHEYKRPGMATNTTLALTATNAAMTKTEALKVAQNAQIALTRCIQPVHTLYDGDMTFAVSVGHRKHDLDEIAQGAILAVMQAIKNAVLSASSMLGLPSAADWNKTLRV